MSVFAAIWWIAGARGSGQSPALVYAVPVPVTVALIASTLRRRFVGNAESPEEEARRSRLVGIASAAEGVLILVAVNVLANTGRSDMTAPVIAIVVGLHFVPLARWLPKRSYYGTAFLLCALGYFGFGIRPAAERLWVVSAGAACVLWVTCALVLFSGRDRTAAH